MALHRRVHGTDARWASLLCWSTATWARFTAFEQQRLKQYEAILPGGRGLRGSCRLATNARKGCKTFVGTAARQMDLSASLDHLVLKLGRIFMQWTQSAITDLDGEERMRTQHLTKALQYRSRELE